LPSLTELLRGRRLRLAVTGLSRSGKTALITSLVHNLLRAARSPARLPFLHAAAEGRLVDARLGPPPDGAIRPFPYRETLAALAADPPQWAAGTVDLRRIDVRLRFTPAGLLGLASPIGRLLGGLAELDLEILDYPGEWLLDLPLLSQNFADWSRASFDLARRGARAPLARDWLDFLARHPADAAADDETARLAHMAYGAFLSACREEAQLSLLQPGRALTPGRIDDPALLWFCPYPLPVGARPRHGSLAALMESRFEAYKTVIARPFFEEIARGVDRQIVLVDVLRALNAGEEAFADQREALDIVLATFRFGRRAWLGRLLGSRVERVLFAASKADHVPALQRDHLEALMANMVEAPRLRAEAARAGAAAMALASIRCTEDGIDIIDGHKVDIVIGLPQGAARRIRFFPGIVPMAPPPSGFWGERFTEFPVFQPPRLDAAAGIPHIGLDKALEFLLGDILA
jgi:predicted YcjX-like family ATPase